MSRTVFTSMGTVISLLTPGPPPAAQVLAAVEREFHDRDRRFSLYRADSEVSALARGELQLTAVSPEFRSTLHRATGWEDATHGSFRTRSPNGVLDLSGLVKAEAMEAAGNRLLTAGAGHWLLNAGGDVLVSGRNGTMAWTVGIVDPLDRTALITSVQLGEPWPALATSGVAERGEHIWGPPGHADFLQVSVLGPDIVTADVLATAIMAGGRRALEASVSGGNIDALCITRDDQLLITPRLRAQVTAPSGSWNAGAGRRSVPEAS
ncbi:FAD:protein FMN transferase [Arthrobacter sp. Y-9]|uniref:FAD:protein FMN transferase n=1 Tax=Arthrobacter sp. Y-9 TaxID=3039385 RepID=UPI00241DD2C3|nr:FAD:protein FMN transferase [Arthrobacter sp. Y-9]WFR82568.1 FAD:protein FMN transferase [Arthrobacter sp. Y-9]